MGGQYQVGGAQMRSRLTHVPGPVGSVASLGVSVAPAYRLTGTEGNKLGKHDATIPWTLSLVAYIRRAYSLRQVELAIGTVDPCRVVQWDYSASLLAAMQLHD